MVIRCKKYAAARYKRTAHPQRLLIKFQKNVMFLRETIFEFYERQL